MPDNVAELLKELAELQSELVEIAHGAGRIGGQAELLNRMVADGVVHSDSEYALGELVRLENEQMALWERLKGFGERLKKHPEIDERVKKELHIQFQAMDVLLKAWLGINDDNQGEA